MDIYHIILIETYRKLGVEIVVEEDIETKLMRYNILPFQGVSEKWLEKVKGKYKESNDDMDDIYKFTIISLYPELRTNLPKLVHIGSGQYNCDHQLFEISKIL